MIEITSKKVLHIFLNGVTQIKTTNPKSAPFFIVSLLVLWDLSTNQISYRTIGTKETLTPYINLNICTKDLQNIRFFDVLNCYDSVFNGNSKNVMVSYHGDIALYL